VDTAARLRRKIMPIYCFTSDVGEIEERIFDMSEKVPLYVAEGGRIFWRNFEAEHPQIKKKKSRGAEWPRESTALGVGTHQVDEAYAASVAAGCPTEFNRETGDAIIKNADHQKKVAAYSGFVDKSSYY